MIGFVVPIKSKYVSLDWIFGNRLLERTMRSNLCENRPLLYPINLQALDTLRKCSPILSNPISVFINLDS
jgi:hypothetical protein